MTQIRVENLSESLRVEPDKSADPEADGSETSRDRKFKKLIKMFMPDSRPESRVIKLNLNENFASVPFNELLIFAAERARPGSNKYCFMEICVDPA